MKVIITPETAADLVLKGIDIDQTGFKVEVRDLDPTKGTLVCADWHQRCYADDLRGLCALCSRAVAFRPHAASRVRKICIRCFLKESKAAKGESA